ncbi:MAG: single-stranded-DNA-specific exonuclease RecJ [Bradymonadales bacterium]|jgi:single-stranded-DNA-specific exonuclease
MNAEQNTNEELSLKGASWNCQKIDPQVIALLEASSYNHKLARCLALIGISDAQSAAAFLEPKITDLYEPELMMGMPKAVARLNDAIKRQESIRVVTDYDVDGTTSSLILQSVLEILGHKDFSYHIPHRMTEGYGFSMRAAECAVADGVKLIVTADIGVRDHKSIAYAQEHGIDVMVLDHHLPEGQGVPEEAFVVLCPPQSGCSYPNPALAACGIALKFAQAMLRSHPKYDLILRSLMKLAALGTVADVVSLKAAENRAIVALGLEELNNGRHKPGLQALLDVSKAERGQITSETIGYRIAPRINAAGRLSTATSIVELLRSNDPASANVMASQIDEINKERQELQAEMLKRVLSELPEELPDYLCIAHKESDTWHRGVVGILAGNVREAINRPVALASIAGDTAVGSTRSIPRVHALKALESASSILLRYGGHAAAAGFTVSMSNWDDFCKKMQESAHKQTQGKQTAAVIDIALELELSDIDDELWRNLCALEPFGKDNPEPMLCFRKLRFNNVRVLQNKHLSGNFAPHYPDIRFIWFGGAEHYEACVGTEVDILAFLRLNRWNGRSNYQLMIQDVRV